MPVRNSNTQARAAAPQMAAARYLRDNYPAFSGDAAPGLGALFIGFDQSAITKAVVPMLVGGPEDRANCFKPDGSAVVNFETDGFPITSGSHIEFGTLTPGAYSAVPRSGASYAAIPLRSVVLEAGEGFTVDLGATTAVIKATTALNLLSVALRLALRNEHWILVSQDNTEIRPTALSYTAAEIIHTSTPAWAVGYPQYADSPIVDESNVVRNAGAQPTVNGVVVKTFTYAPTRACFPSGLGTVTNPLEATLVVTGDVSRMEDFQVPANTMRRIQLDVAVEDDDRLDIMVEGKIGVQARFELLEGDTHSVFCVRSGSTMRFFNSAFQVATDSLPVDADVGGMELRPIAQAITTIVSAGAGPTDLRVIALTKGAGYHEIPVEGFMAQDVSSGTAITLNSTVLGIVKVAQPGMRAVIRILVLPMAGGGYEGFLLLADDAVSQASATTSIGTMGLKMTYAENKHYVTPDIGDDPADVDEASITIRQLSSVGNSGALTPLGLHEAAVPDALSLPKVGTYDLLVKDTHERYAMTFGSAAQVAYIAGASDGVVRVLRLRYVGGALDSAVFLDETFAPVVTGALIAASTTTILEPVYVSNAPFIAVQPVTTGTSMSLPLLSSNFIFSGSASTDKVLLGEPGIYEVRVKNIGFVAATSVSLNGGQVTVSVEDGGTVGVRVLFNGASVTVVPGDVATLQKDALYLATRASGSDAGRVRLVTGIPGHGQASVGVAPAVGSYVLYFTDIIGTTLTITTLQGGTIAVPLGAAVETGCVMLYYDGAQFVAGDPNRSGRALSELTDVELMIRVNYVAGSTTVLGTTVLVAPQATSGVVVLRRVSAGGRFDPLDMSRTIAVPRNAEMRVSAADLDLGLAGLPAPVSLVYYKEGGVTKIGYSTSQGMVEVDGTSGTVDVDLTRFLRPAALLPTGSHSANAWALAKKFKAAGVPTVCCIPALAPAESAADGISYYLPTSFGIYCAMRELSSRADVHRTVIYIAGETMRCLDKRLFVGMPCFEIGSTMCVDNTVSLFALMTSQDQIVIDTQMLVLPEARVDYNTPRAGITVAFSTESTSFCLEDMLGRVGAAGHPMTADGVIEIDHNDRDEYNFLIKDYIDEPFMDRVHVMGVLKDNAAAFQIGTSYVRAWNLSAQKNITALLDVSGDLDGVFNIKYIQAYGQLLPVDGSIRVKQWLNGESGALGLIVAASDSKRNAAALLLSQAPILSIAETSFENFAQEHDLTLYSIQNVNLEKSSPGGFTILAEPAPRVLVPLDVFLAAQTRHIDPNASAVSSPVSGRSRSGRRRL
jgi:hypothetical protein